MNGKKFTSIFIGLIVVCSAAAWLWMKQAYDTRPILTPEQKQVKDDAAKAAGTK